jgi:leader peptidase (prepilin peptidase)/N-methyltransferase
MFIFFLFLLGLAIGSFINCLIYRLNHGMSPLKGRSICPKCKHQLTWYDNIPLLSFALLKGRCRYCQKRISPFYPAVELSTGLLTILVGLKSPYLLPYYLLIFWALIAIFFSDLQYQTIPDEVVYPAIGINLIFLVLFRPEMLLANVLASLLAAAFFIFLVLITKGKGMGWGDVKLVALMGLFLGPSLGTSALFLAFLTGALVGAILVLAGKKKLKDKIAFGPFLSGATMVVFFLSDKVITWLSTFFGI